MVYEIESYIDELQDFRYWLAKTIHVHPGQILMTALKKGPIVVTFLMREKHGNAILEYLKTDDGRIASSRKRIEKIVQNGNVIEIGKYQFPMKKVFVLFLASVLVIISRRKNNKKGINNEKNSIF